MYIRHRILSSAATAALLLGAVSVPTWAAGLTPATFTAANPIGGAPVGWAYAGNKFVGSVLGDGTNRLYSTNLTGGNIQPFGGTVSLVAGHGQEHYVSSSVGLGGFPVGDIYVASGNNIQHISNAGIPDPGLFVSGSTGGINGLVRGITFDSVGTFGNNMIVTTDTGFIYTINNAGVPTQIGSTGEDTEGLDVAPLAGTWGSMNGWLFVASEGSGTIRAIKPGAFTMVTVNTAPTIFDPSFEQLDFVPMVLGNDPLAGMYSANYSVDVLKFNASQFLGREGNLVITGETNKNIYDVTPAGVISIDGAFPNQPEDGLFVTSDLIALDSSLTPEPGTLALLGLGGFAILSRRRSKT